MDLGIVIAITVFFGIAALSTIAHRNAPPSTQVVLVRAEQLKEAERGEAGLGIFLLIAAIVAAILFL
jgi:hypothetical protein